MSDINEKIQELYDLLLAEGYDINNFDINYRKNDVNYSATGFRNQVEFDTWDASWEAS